MVDYSRDETLEEIHDELYEERARSGEQRGGLFQGNSRIFAAIAFGVILILFMVGKITMGQAFFFGAGVLLILYLLREQVIERKELTWLECMIRLHDLLEFVQKHPIGAGPQVPPGEIKVNPIGRKQWYDGLGFKRSFGVDIYDSELDVTEAYYAEVDIYTGDLITFKAAPWGVYGDETRDIKLIASQDMLMQKKREQFMNKQYKY